jgi:hypothetical protein
LKVFFISSCHARKRNAFINSITPMGATPMPESAATDARHAVVNALLDAALGQLTHLRAELAADFTAEALPIPHQLAAAL